MKSENENRGLIKNDDLRPGNRLAKQLHFSFAVLTLCLSATNQTTDYLP